MKKKILTLCMSAALLLQMCPVAFAASAKPPITMQAIATEMKFEDQVIEDSAGSQVTVKYDTIGSAMKDIADGVVTDADGIVCKLDGAKPCKIYIKQSTSSEAYVEQISEKVIISADSIETAEVSDSEITLHFQDIAIAVDTGKQAVQNAITFSGGLEVQSGASLTLGNNVNISQHIINYTFGGDVVVAGELKFDGNMNHDSSVTFSEGTALTVQETGTASIGRVEVSGGSDEQPLITVADGGTLNVSAPKGGYKGGTIEAAGTAIQNNGGTLNLGSGTIKSTSADSSVPVISSNGGEINLKITQETDSQTPPVMVVEGAPAISVTGNANLMVENGNISGANGKPAITVGEEATLNIPDSSNAKVTTSNENGQAIDLAGGSKVQKGDTTITVGADGDSYVGNDGSIILGAGSSVTDPNGTTELPNGGSVDQDGDVTQNALPAESISLNQTSVTLYSNTTPNTVQLIADVTPDNTTDSVAWSSDNEAVATVNESGLVTAVSNGSATITATAGNVSAACTVTVTTYTSGGGSSDDDSDPTYSVTLPKNVKGGEIKSSHRYAEQGDTVTITVDPDKGYELDELTVTDSKGRELDLTDKGNGKYTFKMPGTRVEVEVSFKLIETEPEAPAFADVPASAYYADAVKWAVEQGITSGTSTNTFSPDMSCTRAQIVTFLWRANGSPKADGANPFTDVSADAYYHDAVLWAVKQGITSGTSATTFSPDATVTRGQTVTFLYRAAGAPAVTGGSFADVAADAYYADAVAWAVKEGITSGTGSNSFSPDAPCTRGQIVTFLYRDAK